MFYRILLVSFLLLTAALPGQAKHLAPVRSVKHSVSRPMLHKVTKGETLYSIAFRYERDFRFLARINHIKPPYALKIGQKVRISWGWKPSKHKTKHKVRNKPIRHKVQKKIKKPRTKSRETLSKTNRKTIKQPKRNPISTWHWPANKLIIKRFSWKKRHKGIDIGGKRGQAIRAAAAGIVAYSGSGLQGYGKLLILKHNNRYLSAYAHNRRLLVKEGDKVKVGQKIAEMGSSGTRTVKLHFEIRRAGRPVDPLRYLGRKRI